ncbi:MAG: OmpH family outer membrane protein [Saprospiraceae bacterium]
MRKKYIFQLVALFMFSGLSGSLSAQMKIGYVDLETVILSLPEMQQANEQINELSAKLARNLEVKTNYLNARYQEYGEKVKAGAAEDERAFFVKELDRLQHEIQTTRTKMEESLLKKDRELKEPILLKLEKAIKKVAEQNGYTYILNSTPGGFSFLIDGPEENNLNKALLKEMGVQID